MRLLLNHTHLVGMGDNICELCGMDIVTKKFPLKRPYKLPIKRSSIWRSQLKK